MTQPIQKLLHESDLTEYSGEVIFKYESYLNSFTNRNDFYSIYELELQKAIKENKLNRFCFLCHLLFSFGKNLEEYQKLYCYMIDYVNKDFTVRSNTQNEQVITILLDLFWHQDNGLLNLSHIQQENLSLLLKNCADIKYQIDENGDDIFFAVKKAIDLIKFQKVSEKRKELLDRYLCHFDEKIRQEAKEIKNKNCL